MNPLSVVITQPTYCPWLGFFDRVSRCDLLVVLDTVQFKRRSFMNRNRIKTANDWQWLTVPLHQKGSYGAAVNEMRINNEIAWQRKHWAAIETAYRRAPYFERLADGVRPSYERTFEYFVDLCLDMNDRWFDLLGLDTRTMRATELEAEGTAGTLLVNLCREVGATKYISGPFGREYLDPKEFERNGIDVVFHEFQSPQYPQLHEGFVPNLSIIDVVANVDDPLELAATGAATSKNWEVDGVNDVSA